MEQPRKHLKTIPLHMNNQQKYSKYTYHGGPYNRGLADSYYRRVPSPHKYLNGTYNGDKIVLSDHEEISAYWAGYKDNEEEGDFKDYGQDIL